MNNPSVVPAAQALPEEHHSGRVTVYAFFALSKVRAVEGVIEAPAEFPESFEKETAAVVVSTTN
jgi:hypothetical protein